MSRGQEEDSCLRTVSVDNSLEGSAKEGGREIEQELERGCRVKREAVAGV